MTVATDGERAVELYWERLEAGVPFDAIILDLTVPDGMGGYEALQRIREIDPAVRALVSSGYSEDPIMAQHQKFGFCGVVVKPYRLQELRSILDVTFGAAGDTA